MTNFQKLDQIRKHLQLDQPRDEKPMMAPSSEPASGKRVQKNLSILEHDAERLRALAERNGLSQARTITALLDLHERSLTK